MGESMKNKFIIISATIVVIAVIFSIISTNYIYLNSYNDGEKGLVKFDNVERVELYDSDNRKSTLNKLRKCKNIDTLFIEFTVDDFYFLEGMNLKNLYIMADCNNWQSLQCLDAIKGLYIIPVISDNYSTFDDCSVIQKFDMMAELDVNNFEKEIDFSGLEKLNNLSSMKINSYDIDFSKIQFPKTLKQLTIRFGENDDIDHFPKNIELVNNSNIETIRFFHSCIFDISLLYNISGIKKIEFNYCDFKCTESELNDVISDLKNKNIYIVLNDNTFLNK